MRIGKHTFDTDNRCYIMGILNVTPDSFSDGGSYSDVDAALFHTGEMIRDGASVIDVGGESTRPGYTPVTDEEEIGRVVPVIQAIKANYDIPVSVDTYKSSVAKAALLAGADLVNDIWGLTFDEEMASVIASFDAACCLMHNRRDKDYRDFLTDWMRDLKGSVNRARAAGIREDGILVDPGVGFAKTYEQNLQAIKYAGNLKQLGYPVLLGTSRKSVIGLTLDLPGDQREEGTLATTVMGVMQGVSFVRVHDVAANARAIRMTEAVLAGKKL